MAIRVTGAFMGLVPLPGAEMAGLSAVPADVVAGHLDGALLVEEQLTELLVEAWACSLRLRDDEASSVEDRVDLASILRFERGGI
jgi:hypothetical protein